MWLPLNKYLLQIHKERCTPKGVIKRLRALFMVDLTSLLLKELGNRNLKGLSKAFQVIYPHIPLRPLNGTNISTMKAARLGEIFLGPTSLFPKGPNPPGEQLSCLVCHGHKYGHAATKQSTAD